MSRTTLLFKTIYWLLALCLIESFAFNLSPVPNKVFSGPRTRGRLNPESNYFGYSIVLREKSIIIGAPRTFRLDTVTGKPHNTGIIYRCDVVLKKTACKPYNFEVPTNAPESYDAHWLGAAMDGSSKDNEKLLVCAPRFNGPFDPDGKTQYMQGVCYWTQDTLSETPKKTNYWWLQPLIDTDKQVGYIYEYDKIVPNYKRGQAGFSAHVTADNKEFLLGAVGVTLGKGIVVHFNTQSAHYDIMRFTVDMDYNYVGYAIASGYLDNVNPRKTVYVTTAPHAYNLRGNHGMAIIYDFNNFITEYKRLIGNQHGEFFGYAVVVDDINGDGLDDILITAPQYSLPKIVDAGAVYVFLNLGAFNFEETFIRSPFLTSSRFGTTISKLGDINLDGYNDIAIGAPFDGNGSVAIYLGGPHGLREIPSQILNITTCKEYEPNIKQQMFGHGLSKGVDMDKNGYNDLAIGAPNTDRVYLYRTYPVVQIVTNIKSNVTVLEPENQQLSLEICWDLLTNASSTTLTQQQLLLSLEIDVELKRAHFPLNNSHILQLNETGQRQINCRNILVDVTFSLRDIYTPLRVKMRAELINDGSQEKYEFCENCAVTDPKKLAVTSYVLSFSHDCKCNVQIFVPNTFRMGSANTIPINYTISDMGGYAQFSLSTEPVLPFAKIPSMCFVDDTNNTHPQLNCVLSKGFIATIESTITLGVLLDVSNMLTGNELIVQTESCVNGQSDRALKINTIQLEEWASITVIGQPLEPFIELQSCNETTLMAINAIELQNTGPCTLHDLTISVMLPLMLNNTELYNMSSISLEVQQYGVPIEALPFQLLTMDGKKPTAVATTNANSDRNLTLSCGHANVNCAENYFKIAKFRQYSKIQIALRHTLNVTHMMRLMKTANIDYLTVKMLVDFRRTNNWHNKLELQTKLQPLTYVYLPPEQASLWYIIIAIIGGCLLLAALSYALHRKGFFLRKIRKQLEKQRSELRQSMINEMEQNEEDESEHSDATTTECRP